MRPRRTLTLSLPLLIALPLLAVVAPQTALASDPVGNLIEKTQSARADNGLPAYSIASDLASVAQQHAEAEAANHSDYHNPSLTTDVCCWSSIGENVGEGPNASSIHQAFMGSSEHRANILSSTFTQMGIGAARDSSGTLYVDEVFREPDGSSGGSGGTTTTHHRHHHHHATATSSPAPVTRTVTPTVSRSETRAPLVTAPRQLTFGAALAHALHAFRQRSARAPDPVTAALRLSTMLTRVADH